MRSLADRPSPCAAVLPPLPTVEPALEQQRGRGAIDTTPLLARVEPLRTQARGRLPGREPFIIQLHPRGRRLRELFGEGADSASGGAFAALELARQPQHEHVELFGALQLLQLLQQGRLVAAIEKRAGVGQQAELIGDGQADPNGSQVDRSRTHWLPFSTFAAAASGFGAELDPIAGPEHKPGAVRTALDRTWDPLRLPTLPLLRKPMEFRAVKGMNDILPDEVGRFKLVENAFRRVMDLHGFSEVRTPLLEPTELFVRSTGETSEIVEKQMFSLTRESESLTLRPEGTPGTVRAFLNHSVHAKEPITRWFYVGPMFRAERPQRGRSRQFHQAGCEVFGDAGPVVDAEIVDMLVGFLNQLGITDLEVRVNSIGGAVTRQKYREALLAHLTPRQHSLSEHARRRLLDNPLRILDSKDPRDREAVVGAPSILDLLEPDDRAHWDGFRAALDALGTPYVVDAGLVRGLDYYSRTLFELVSNQGELGSQNTLLGGGRYDGMVHELGGPKLPAIGFGIGLERLLLASPLAAPEKAPRCFIAPLGAAALAEALQLARELRAAGIGTDLDGRGASMKSMLRRADSLGARVCLVLGESEVQAKQVQLKDLASHSQQVCARAEVLSAVARVLASAPQPGQAKSSEAES